MAPLALTLGDGHHLLLALHGAGTGHDGQGAAADLGVAHLHYGILRVELAVGVFVGFLDPLHVLHDIQGGDQVDIQLGGVAYQAQNGMGLADAGVDGDTLLLEPGDQTLKLVTVGVVFQYDDHGVIPPKYNVGIGPGMKKTRSRSGCGS